MERIATLGECQHVAAHDVGERVVQAPEVALEFPLAVFGSVPLVENVRQCSLADRTATIGASEDVVRLISAKKEEPEWMLEFRLRAYRTWMQMTDPQWAHVEYPPVDYQDIVYYSAPKKSEKKQSLDEVDPELLATFDKLGIGGYRHMAGVAMQAFQLMGRVCEILETLGVAGTTKQVTAFGAQGLSMDPVTVEATDPVLSMLAQLPFLVGLPVAVPAHLRGDGQGHFSVLLGMSLAHDAVTGLAGHTRVGIGFSLRIRTGRMANETGEFTACPFPGLLKSFAGISQGMR